MIERLDRLNTAVLTGPTGMLGKYLTRKLVAEQVTTYVVCHPGSQRIAEIIDSPYVHKVECDMSELAHLPELIDTEIDAFFHFAWMGTSDAQNRMNMPLQALNLTYTVDAVLAAQKLGAKVFIGAGSQAEYGRVEGVIHPDTLAQPISGYGMAKLCAGQMTRTMCQEYGIRHIWPRIVSTYGIGDAACTLVSTVTDTLLRGERPQLTAGEQIWDYLYAGDAADAFYRMALCGQDGAVYVLGSGRTRPLREFMLAIRDAIDPSLPLGIGERPYYVDQAMHLEADVASLTADTGWVPSTPFEVGIAEIIEYKRSVLS